MRGGCGHPLTLRLFRRELLTPLENFMVHECVATSVSVPGVERGLKNFFGTQLQRVVSSTQTQTTSPLHNQSSIMKLTCKTVQGKSFSIDVNPDDKVCFRGRASLYGLVYACDGCAAALLHGPTHAPSPARWLMSRARSLQSRGSTTPCLGRCSSLRARYVE